MALLEVEQNGKTVLLTAAKRMAERPEDPDSLRIRGWICDNWQDALKRPIDSSLLDTLAALDQEKVGRLLDQLPKERMVLLFGEKGKDADGPFTEPLVRALRITREADNIRKHSRHRAYSPGLKQTMVPDLSEDLWYLSLRFQQNPHTDAARLFEDSRAVVKDYYSSPANLLP